MIALILSYMQKMRLTGWDCLIDIPTFNIASILMSIDIDDAMPIVMGLSKTNYIYPSNF